MVLHENRLPADDSQEISCLICHFGKSGKIWNCHLLQIIGGALSVKIEAEDKTVYFMVYIIEYVDFTPFVDIFILTPGGQANQL